MAYKEIRAKKESERGPKYQDWYENVGFCKVIALVALGFDTRKKITDLNEVEILKKDSTETIKLNIMPTPTLNILTGTPRFIGTKVIEVSTDLCSKHNKKFSINWLKIKDLLKKIVLDELEKERIYYQEDYNITKENEELYIKLVFPSKAKSENIIETNKVLSKDDKEKLTKSINQLVIKQKDNYINSIKDSVEDLKNQILTITKWFNDMDEKQSEELLKISLKMCFITILLHKEEVNLKDLLIRVLNQYDSYSRYDDFQETQPIKNQILFTKMIETAKRYRAAVLATKL